ncbi:MAG: PIN domain-containing protein [Chloroflexota bacterium]
MSLASLEQALGDGERLLVDTTSLIAYFDQTERISPLALHVLNELIFSGRNPAVVSMVSIMEVLVRPMRVGAVAPYTHLLHFLTNFPNLRPLPVDLFVAQEAASLRAGYRLSTADALIVGTGLVAQVHHLVTNDADWVRKLQPINSRIRVCLLSHHV